MTALWSALLAALVALVAPGTISASTPAAVEHHAPPSTAAVAPAGSQCSQWYGLALDIGWPADQWPMLDHVMWRESRCRETATHQNANGTVDRGLLQVNSVHLPWLAGYGLTAADLTTAGGCLQAALLLWQIDGWGPWKL